MIDITPSIEALKNNLIDAETNTTSVQNETNRKKIVLDAFKQISEFFSNHNQSTKFQDVRQHLSPSIQLMLKGMGDSNTDVRLSADDHLKKVIKSRIESHSDKILVVLFKGMKFPNKHSQRGAIQHFASVCQYIRPQKCRTFVQFLLPQFTVLFQACEPIILILLGEAMESILEVLGFYFEEDECKSLLDSIIPLLSNDSVEVRRGASQTIGHICRYITKCPINDVSVGVYDVAMSTIKEDVDGNYHCTNRDCLQGCIQTFTQLLDVFDLFSQRSSRATTSHYSMNQLFANLICDLLLQSLGINDQKTLTASFSLGTRLLTVFGNYCKNWRKEKVNDLIRKIFITLTNNSLITVKSSALEAVERFILIFPEITLKSFNDNKISLSYLFSLSCHEDYLIRGKVSIVLAAIIRSSIANFIDLSIIPTLLLTDTQTTQVGIDLSQEYTHIELLHIMVMHLIDMTQKETNSLCLKMMCSACGECLPHCLFVPEFSHRVPQLLHTFVNIDDTFWGVKFEILSLLQVFDYTVIEYYERKRITSANKKKSCLLSRSITQVLLEEVVWKYISDESARVRQQACQTFLKIIPHLNGTQEDSQSNNQYFIERHTDEYEAILLNQVLSEKMNKYANESRDIVRDHELRNVVVIMKRCIAELNVTSTDKDKLSGLLELMHTLAKSYGVFDDTSPYYINLKKPISAVGHPILSFFALEILQKMLDFIHFSEISNDLTIHAVIVETIGIFCLELTHVKGSTQKITQNILLYLLFMLEVISDLDEKPTLNWNDKMYAYSKRMSGFVFEKLYTNIQRSLRASATNLENLDSISVLRGKLLNALYFLTLGGHQVTIVDNCTKIVQLLQLQVAKDRLNTILCTQELFAVLFSQKNNYYSIETSTKKSPVIENCLKRSFFDVLFSNCSLDPQQALSPDYDSTFQRVRTYSLVQNVQQSMMLAHPSVGNLTVQGVLEMFEPIVTDVITSFKGTHSHELQNIILFMLTRMVCVNVDFHRLDKDDSLMKHILKLIHEMQAYLSDHDPDQTLYQIMDFVSVLIFTVRYNQSKELDEKVLLETITQGLSSTRWSTSVLLRSLSPLMIRSYLHNIRNPPKLKSADDMENNYGRSLLQIFLDHIRYPECLSVLTVLLQNVSQDSKTWKSLTNTICDKLVKDCKFDLEINWFNVTDEIQKIYGLFDALVVSTEDPVQVSCCRRVYVILQTDLIPTLEAHVTTPLTPSSPRQHESHLNRSLDAKLLKALIIMKFLNNMRYLQAESSKMKDMFTQFMEVTKCALGHYVTSKVTIVKQMRIYMSKILGELFVLTANLLERLDDISFISEELEELRQYFDLLTDPSAAYRMSFPVYTALIAIFLHVSRKDATFALKFKSTMAEQFMKTKKANLHAHRNAIIAKLTFLPICYLMAETSESCIPFFESNEQVRNGIEFWSQLYTEVKEPVVSRFVRKFNNDVSAIEDEEEKERLTVGLTQFIQDRVRHFSKRNLHLSGLRKLVKLVENLPPLRSVLEIFIAEKKASEHLPTFFHKKIYKDIITYICLKDPALESVPIFNEKQKGYSLEESKNQVEQEIIKYTENIYKSEDVVAGFIARFHPFSEQSTMKYAPHMVGSMNPQMQKTVIELSKSYNWDINRLSDVINSISTAEQLETFFAFFFEKIQSGLKSEQQKFSMYSGLATDISKLIEKHFELSETQNLESSFYCRDDNKIFLIQFYCMLVQLFYAECVKNTVDTADVDVMLSSSLDIIEFVDFQSDTNTNLDLEEYWEKFIIHMAKLLMDMTTVDSKTKLSYLTGSETVEKSVKRIVSRTYVLQKDDKAREFSIGNLIPFVSMKHIPIIRRAAIKICQRFPSLAYARFLPQDDGRHPTIYGAHVQLLNLMANELSCDSQTFKPIWDMCFELFREECEMTTFDEMQLSSLKLLTNLLCLVRFSEPPPLHTKKAQTKEKHIKQYGPALFDLLETIDKYQLKSVKYKQKEKRQFIILDEQYSKGIFNSFMKLADAAIKLHRKSNPVFVKEILKSLTLIMSRSPSLFLSTQPDAYSFKWVYDTYSDLYIDCIKDEDWLIRQYVVLGLAKGYAVLYNKEEMINARSPNNPVQIIENQSNFILRVLQDAMADSHTRLCGLLSVLIFIQHKIQKLVTKYLPYISENFQKWFLEDNQTVHSVNLQIRMITSIIEFYPESSTHDVTRKAMEALFSVADNSRTPLAIVSSIYESLQHLLANFALSHFERKLIEAMTSIQTTKSKVIRATTEPKEPPKEEQKQKSSLFPRIKYLSFENFAIKPSTSNTAIARSVSIADIDNNPLLPENRRNSLSRVPTLFYRVAKPQLSTVGTAFYTPQLVPTSKSAFSSITLTAPQKPKESPDQVITRHLRRTEPKSISRNSHTRRVLKLGLLVTSMYTAGFKQTEEKQEHVRVNVLQLFEQLHVFEMHREAEVLLKFIPRLLEDFFDSEQILPLIYNEFLSPKTHPSLLSLFLRIHLPAAYEKMQQAEDFDSALNSFGTWIRMSLETISLKKPISHALWGLLNLFVCVCLCPSNGEHHQASFVETGSVLPQTVHDSFFAHAFLLYGVCFHAVLRGHLSQLLTPFKQLLNQLLSYVDDKVPENETDSWKDLVRQLIQLLEIYEKQCAATNHHHTHTNNAIVTNDS